MNNYEKICDILSQGCYAGVSYHECDGLWIYKFKYGDGITYDIVPKDTDMSYISDTDITPSGIHYYSNIINYNIKDIKIISVKPKLLSIGDTVIILDSLKKVGTYESFDTEKKLMVGKKYQIRSIEDDSYGLSYTIRNNCNYQFPSWTICKCDPDPIDVIEIGGVKYSKEEFQNAVKNLNPIN